MAVGFLAFRFCVGVLSGKCARVAAKTPDVWLPADKKSLGFSSVGVDNAKMLLYNAKYDYYNGIRMASCVQL